MGGKLGAHRIAVGRTHGKAQALRQVRVRIDDLRHEVQLAAHFMAHVAGGRGGDARIGVGNPVGQQGIRVLAAVRQAQRNARQEAQHRGRQRVLRVDRKDDGRVERTVAQRADERGRLLGIGGVGMLGPRHVAGDHVVDVAQVRLGDGPGARGQQREVPVGRAARLERVKGRRGHHHVAEVVGAHAQDAGGVGPHGAALGDAGHVHATASAWRACWAMTMAAASSKRPTM